MSRLRFVRRPRTFRRAGLAIAALATATSLSAACSADQDGPSGAAVKSEEDGYHGTLVDSPLEMAPVTLRDTAGDRVRLDRLDPDTATAVFFGFTNCDDVCPTTMADLAAARRVLPPQVADRVTVLFITVDPDRDTAAVLRTWLDQFDSAIVGLRGPTSLVHRAERSLYASESGKAAIDRSSDETDHPGEHQGGNSATGRDHSDYEVDHDSVVYVFGPDEETVLYTGGATPIEYAADFERLLGET